MALLSPRIATAAMAAVLVAGNAALAQASPMVTCTVGDLHVTMGRQDRGAGQVYWPILFTNINTFRCALRGYPGVSVLDGKYQQMAPPATRTGEPFRTVIIRPGQTATALIHTTNGPLDGEPCRPASTYLRVYPPASYQAVLIRASLRVCTSLFETGPLTADTS